MKSVCIVGAGTMGAGIAQWFATNGIKTFLTDNNQRVVEAAKQSISNSYQRLVKKNKFTQNQVDQSQANLNYLLAIEDIPKDIDLVIEAIVERLEIKKELFKNLDSHFCPQTIFASNTSGLSIEKIFHDLPNRLSCGLHFFNPAPVMKLVEIIKSKTISDEKLMNLHSFFLSRDKVPVIVKDQAGFICNRVARNFYGESFRILNDDDPYQMNLIDQTLKHVGGFKMGPFELMDLIGVDINLNATKGVYESFGHHPRFAPHSYQVKSVESGRLGRKTNNQGLILGRLDESVSFFNIFVPLKAEDNHPPQIIDYDELSHDYPEDSIVFDKTRFNLEEKKQLITILKERNNKIISEGSHLTKQFTELSKKLSFDVCATNFYSKTNTIEYIQNLDEDAICQAFSNHQDRNVFVRKNHLSLGLIFPRVLIQIIHEANIAFDEDLASKKDIDLAMKYGLNYPHGPFEWEELIGKEIYELLRVNLMNSISKKPNRYSR
ncbi:MAG: hypothetical protein CME61_04075 [Halobacteriovoraceae bacterium]|nr:hypothetical protein [Halobacteriovoraceae bacterium]